MFNECERIYSSCDNCYSSCDNCYSRLENTLYVALHYTSKQSLYNYISDNNLLNKYIEIILVKPSDVKYYFVKANNIDITPNNNQLTILEGMTVEQSNLLTKPVCMTENEYKLIPNEYKGQQYNIYYEKYPHIVNIRYTNINETQQYLACFNSQRVVYMYTIVNTIKDIDNILFFNPICIFIH